MKKIQFEKDLDHLIQCAKTMNQLKELPNHPVYGAAMQSYAVVRINFVRDWGPKDKATSTGDPARDLREGRGIWNMVDESPDRNEVQAAMDSELTNEGEP